MTTATDLGLAQQHRNQLIEDRRRALNAIAESVRAHRGHCIEDFPGSVLQLIVPVLAGAGVRSPMVEFEQLVDAIDAAQSFDNDPAGWLEGSGMHTDEATAVDQYQSLQDAVESALDRLMGRRS